MRTIFLCGMVVFGFALSAATPTRDGDPNTKTSAHLNEWYSQRARQASDSGQLTVGLTMLLFDKLPLQEASWAPPFTAVNLELNDRSLGVILRDAKGKDFAVRERIPITEQDHRAGVLCKFVCDWSLPGSGETRPSHGRRITTLSVERDGGLRADILIENDADRSRESRSSPVRSWISYPRLVPDHSASQSPRSDPRASMPGSIR